jgi:hypothetical protein
MNKFHPWLVFWLAMDALVIWFVTQQPILEWPSSKTLTMLVDDQRLYHQIDQLDTHGQAETLRFVHDPRVKDWPRFKHLRPIDLPFKIDRLSSLQDTSVLATTSSSTFHQLIIIDDWTKAQNLQLPIWPQPSTNSKPMVIFLDRSGTMKKKSTAGNNPLAQSYATLTQKRKSSAEPWRLISFSDVTVDHGLWDVHGPVPMEAFESSQGQTKLMEALQSFLTQQTQACQMVILSDGQIDTRHRESIERLFTLWQGQGHQLTLLSPEGYALKEWEWAYTKLGLGKAWPTTLASTTRHRHTVDERWGFEWSGVQKSFCSQACIPTLFDQQGTPLLYLENKWPRLCFYAMGVPESEDKLVQALQKEFKLRPTVQLQQNQLSISIDSDSLAALEMHFPLQQNFLPLSPGQYELNLNAYDRIELFHPETGIFELDQLSSWNVHVESPALSPPLKNTWRSTLLPLLIGLQFCWFLLALFPNSYKIVYVLYKKKFHATSR